MPEARASAGVNPSPLTKTTTFWWVGTSFAPDPMVLVARSAAVPVDVVRTASLYRLQPASLKALMVSLWNSSRAPPFPRKLPTTNVERAFGRSSDTALATMRLYLTRKVA